MTNREWLTAQVSRIPNDRYYNILDVIMHDYGKMYGDKPTIVSKWLEEEYNTNDSKNEEKQKMNEFDKSFEKAKKCAHDMFHDCINCFNNVNPPCKEHDCKKQSVEKTASSKSVKLSSPWWEYYHKLEALFGEDPEICMEYDDLKKEIVMRVDNWKKADAIEKLLPSEVSFGNVTVTIVVIPGNGYLKDRSSLIDVAFSGNPVFDKVIAVDPSMPITGGTSYVMFRKKVAQFFNDNLADPHGNSSYLYADIAKDVLGYIEGENLHFSTSTEE